jgi:hypothetical protein
MRMISLKSAISLAVLIMALQVNAASAFDFQNCKITEIVMSGLTNAHVALDCAITPRPTGCATAGSYFGFDKSTEEGKQYLSLILTAYASNSNVTGLVNDNLCSPTQGNVSWLEHIRMTK